MAPKIRIGLLFGGRSAEHEVSLQSARNIINGLDRDKYEPVLIGIDRQGKWYLSEASRFLLDADKPERIKLGKATQRVVLLQGQNETQLLNLSDSEDAKPLDVVFPILHGPFGEDGTVQGLLKLADLPFVGADVAGSAVGMDKDIQKRLFRDAGIPAARFVVLHKHIADEADYRSIKGKLGLPLFVKPANLGSSVGVSKAHNETELLAALETAFKYDRKVLIEEAIEGQEIECSVLGNENPLASLPGRVIPQSEFYSYRAKYIDEHGAQLEIPADLDAETTKRIQEMSVRVFKVLCCEGMARVDFFLDESGQLLINEINTIPGFTGISMYPKLWEVSGISKSELLDRLIELAMQRFDRNKNLKTTVNMEE